MKMKLLGLIVGLMFAITFRSLAAVPSGPPGGMTLNAVQKATGTNSLGDSAFSSVGTNGALVGDFTANGAAFATTPTVNGSPVLTNAPGGGITNSGAGTINTVAVWTDTNSLGNSLLTSDSANDVVGIGDGALFGTTAINSTHIVALGRQTLQNAVLDNMQNVFSLGVDSMDSLLATNSVQIYTFGENLINDSSVIVDSGEVFAYGYSSMDAVGINNSTYLFAYGNAAMGAFQGDTLLDFYAYGQGALDTCVATNSSQVFAYGTYPLQGATILDSSDLYAYGNAALASAIIADGSQGVYAYGSSALANALITNSSDIFAIGNDAGSGLVSDGLSHIFILGSGGTATNSNDFVFGDSLYNYFFPGAGATFANYIRLSGNTNQYTDDGTNLLRNGVPITSTATNFVGIYRDQSIEAGAMFPGPTAATFGQYTNTVNDTMSDSWTFADAVTQSARFALTMPDTWDIGTVKLKLYVTCDTTNVATTTNIVWGIKAGSLGPGEALTNAVFGTQVFVTNGLNIVGNVQQVFLTPAITVGGSPAMGDSIWFDISRQGANASDTWTNTPVRMLKARLQWLEASTAPSSW